MSANIPKLSCGLRYGTDSNGKRICLGAEMGRPNTRPASPSLTVKFSLRRLRLVDGAYDQGGAYWGTPANLWRAVSLETHPWLSNWDSSVMCGPWNKEAHIEIFVRAESREEAKESVRDLARNAKFFR